MKTITIHLTEEQAEALEFIADYGVQEKEYQLEIEESVYSDEDRAEAARTLVHANDAIGLLQKAMHEAYAREKSQLWILATNSRGNP